MSEITKGEWWIQVWNEGTRYESVHINPPLGGNDSHAVATLSGPDAKANTRHIVHCVNNHERLVSMLDKVLNMYPWNTAVEAEARALLDEIRKGESSES